MQLPILLTLFLLPALLHAQEFAWERTYSPVPEGAYGNEVRGLVPTNDGGALLVCSIKPSLTTSNYALTMIRVNADGDSLWMRSAGTARNTMPSHAFRRGSGTIVFGRSTGLNADTAARFDIYVAAVDSAGGLLWERAVGDGRNHFISTVVPTRDTAFLVVGLVQSSRFYEHLMVMKIGIDGDLRWRREFPTLASGFAALQIEQGHHVIAGHTGGFSSQPSDLYMLRLDAEGDSLWYRTIPTAPKEYVNALLRIDSTYVVIGLTSELTSLLNPLVIHTDLEFRPLSRQVVGDTADYKRVSEVRPIPGGYLSTGMSEDSSGFSKPYFLRFDPLGRVVEERRFEPSDTIPRRPLRMFTFPDGTAFVAGASGEYLYEQPWAARINIAVSAVDEKYRPRIREIDLR